MTAACQQRMLGHLLCAGAGLAVGWGTSKLAWRAWHALLQWLWPQGPLQLQRPLVTLDIEATGLNVSRDRVLEIAAIKLMPDGTVLTKGPQRLNPRTSISAEVTAIHGIAAADVAGCPTFEDVAAEWHEWLDGCDLHGYNAKKFDVPILRSEFRRAGLPNFPPLGVPVVDSFRLFCLNEPRSLGAAVAFYCGRPHAGAHTAMADADAALCVLRAQVRRYRHLPRGVSELAALCGAPTRGQDVTGDGKFQWRGDTPVLGFGKHAGEPLAVVMTQHKDFLRWMSGQDFSDESLIVVAKALSGLLPTKQGGWEPLVLETVSGPAPAAAPAVTKQEGCTDKQQQQQQQQQQQVERQQQQAARGISSDDGGPGNSSATEDGSGGGAGAADEALQQWQQQRRSRPRSSRAVGVQQQQQQPAAEVAAVPTGWPELGPLQPGQHDQFSWANDDSAAAAAPEAASEISAANCATDSNGSSGWGSASSPDSWSLVEQPTPAEPPNPEPQEPHSDAEGAGSVAAGPAEAPGGAAGICVAGGNGGSS